MQLAKVIGHATATVKHESLVGQKLLIVQPLAADGYSPDGDPLIVIDAVSGGRGDVVLITSDGKYTRERLKSDKSPARWAAIGLQDEVVRGKRR